VQSSFIRFVTLIIPPAIYVGIVVLTKVEFSATVVVSLLFLAVAYALCAWGYFLVPKGRTSAVLGMSSAMVASVYLGVEFFLATLLIYLPRIPVTVAIIIQLIPAGLFLVAYLTTVSSTIEISRNLDEQRSEVLVVQTAIARLASLQRTVTDPQLAKSIAGLSEEFRYSPTKRPAEVRSQDVDIAIAFDLLEEYVRSGADAETISAQVAAISVALADRNNMIKRLQ
jgi:hypothetical protein